MTYEDRYFPYVPDLEPASLYPFRTLKYQSVSYEFTMSAESLIFLMDLIAPDIAQDLRDHQNALCVWESEGGSWAE